MDLPDVHISGEWDARLESFLAERIYEFNSSATGLFDGKGLVAEIKDGAGRSIGAAAGHTWGGTCQLTYLWVDAAHRLRGLGSALLMAVESEARRRNCRQVILLTHDFQAPVFYERHGYRRLAEIANYPVGHSQFIYVRHLVEPEGA